MNDKELEYKILEHTSITNFDKYSKMFLDLLRRANILQESEFKYKYGPTNKNYFDLLSVYKFFNIICTQSLSKEIVKETEKELFIKYVHTTASLEGNTLTSNEVRNYLNYKANPRNKTQNEVNQINNLIFTKQWLDISMNDVDESFIKDIHTSIMYGCDGYDSINIPGIYRTKSKQIVGATISPVSPEYIEKEMNELIINYQENLNQNIHPLECIAIFHGRFEQIHPFDDGNGRTGRSLLDYMLKQHGYPTIYIPKSKREQYLNSLNEYDYNNPSKLIDFFIERISISIWYFFTRTKLYKEFEDRKDMESFFNRFGANDLFKALTIILDEFHNSKEDP